MDALMLLTADHNRVRGLFARFEEAHEKDDAALMAAICEQAVVELKVHTTIEEDVFYPFVRQLGDQFSEDLDEAVEEHHVVDVLIEELGQVEAGSDTWVAKFTVLMENV